MGSVPGIPEVGSLIESERDGHVVLISRATPTTSTLHPSAQEGVHVVDLEGDHGVRRRAVEIGALAGGGRRSGRRATGSGPGRWPGPPRW